MLLVDTLSPLPSQTNTQIQLDPRVDTISISAFTRSHLTKNAAETQQDPILSAVHRLTLNGWPNRCTNVPRIARNYWDFRDELSIKDDLLMKGEQVIIPPSCRDLHKSHTGINKALALARTCVYWPGMEADVRDYIKICLMCIKCSNLPVETLHPHEVPPDRYWVLSRPSWEKTFNHCRLLQQVPICLPSSIYTSFQDHQPSQKSLHSWRHTNHCDWQWPSIQWRWIQKVCLRIWLCAHHIITSFPLVQWFHQGNGEESQECLKVIWQISNAQARALLQLWDTPILTDLPSPAEILHGQPAQGAVISRPSKLINICQIWQRLIEIQNTQKEQFDRAHRAKDL